MHPELSGIDHVHVYVDSWAKAEPWYRDTLGFRAVEKYRVWAVPGGPLTLEDPGGTVHLALFESDEPPSSTVAFGATGEQFLAWKKHLEARGVELRISDHDLSWSLYFHDPFDNLYEITTNDHGYVSGRIEHAG